MHSKPALMIHDLITGSKLLLNIPRYFTKYYFTSLEFVKAGLFTVDLAQQFRVI